MEYISIELVLSIAKTTYDFCKDVHDAPEQIKLVKKDTKKTCHQVERLQGRMKNPKFTLGQTEKEVAMTLREDFKEILRYSKTTKRLVAEWNGIQTAWAKWPLCAAYVARNKSRFAEIHEGLAECRKSITEVLVYINNVGIDKQLEQGQRLFLESEQLKLLVKKLSDRSVARTQLTARCAKTQQWADHNERRITNAAMHPDDKVKENLVNDLVAAGVPRDKAAETVRDLLKSVRKETGRSRSNEWKQGHGMEKGKQKGAAAENGEHKKEPGQKQEAKKQEPKKEEVKKQRPKKEEEKQQQPKKGNIQKKEPGKQEQKQDPKKDPKQDPPKKASPEPKKVPMQPILDHPKSQAGDAGKKPEKTSPKPANALGNGKAPKPEVKDGKQQNPTKPTVAKTVRFADKDHPRTEGDWILFVDRLHGARATMAHLYLELLRLWTMNSHKRWLFARASWCSLDIPTPLVRSPATPVAAGPCPSEAALVSMAGNPEYFWSRAPDAKAAVVARLRDRTSRGLYEADFSSYKHIVCFDDYTRRELEGYRDLVAAKNNNNNQKQPEKMKTTAKITCLVGCERWIPSWINKPDELAVMRGKIKIAVKMFLSQEFGWLKPAEAFSYGKWQTLQVVVKKDEYMRLISNKQGIKAVDKMGCKLNVVPERSGEKWLVSISGPHSKLFEAQQAIFPNGKV